jgi:hypothetical protein
MDQEREDYDEADTPRSSIDWCNLVVIAFAIAVLVACVVLLILIPPVKENT